MPTVGTDDDGVRSWREASSSSTTSWPAERALVGRVSEFDVIRKAVMALDRDWRLPILALVGEQGIGKSRLLGETAALAEANGQLVLRGRAAEFEQDLPFAAFVDALEHHVVSVD